MTSRAELIRDRDNVWKRYYEMERKRDAVLAAVRSVFGLDEEYADRVVESVTQPNGSGGYTFRPGSHRVSGLPRLEADLIAASDSKRATDALARLTKRKPANVTVNVQSPSKAAERAAVRTPRPPKNAA